MFSNRLSPKEIKKLFYGMTALAVAVSTIILLTPLTSLTYPLFILSLNVFLPIITVAGRVNDEENPSGDFGLMVVSVIMTLYFITTIVTLLLFIASRNPIFLVSLFLSFASLMGSRAYLN